MSDVRLNFKCPICHWLYEVIYLSCKKAMSVGGTLVFICGRAPAISSLQIGQHIIYYINILKRGRINVVITQHCLKHGLKDNCRLLTSLHCLDHYQTGGYLLGKSCPLGFLLLLFLLYDCLSPENKSKLKGNVVCSQLWPCILNNMTYKTNILKLSVKHTNQLSCQNIHQII